MFYQRNEGESYRCGFNYTKTATGHGVALCICLPFSWRAQLGYYWGIKFKPRWVFYNKKKEDERLVKNS